MQNCDPAGKEGGLTASHQCLNKCVCLEGKRIFSIFEYMWTEEFKFFELDSSCFVLFSSDVFSDVFCGLLLCTNLTRAPRIGQLQGEIIPTSFYHQGRVIDCR